MKIKEGDVIIIIPMVVFANSYIFYNDRLRLNNYCILK